MIYTKNAKPIYKKFKGWNTTDQSSLEDFIQYIESEVGVKIDVVSTGVGRHDLYERY
jgi:adenylosuccinate synthase